MCQRPRSGAALAGTANISTFCCVVDDIVCESHFAVCQCSAWATCMLQLQARACVPLESEGDDDTCDCIEWLSVLAAAVPPTSPTFSAQLLAAGVDENACVIAVLLPQ
jgi:hypothetical protein